MNIRHAAAAAMLTVFAAGAFAQAASAPGTNTPRIDAREAKQEARIQKGEASGQLTQGEGKAMQAQQNHISRMEDRAKADGSVSAAERERITHAQNRANRDIRRQKHDAQGASSAAGK